MLLNSASSELSSRRRVYWRTWAHIQVADVLSHDQVETGVTGHLSDLHFTVSVI